MLEFYLSPANSHHWAAIQEQAQLDTPESFELLRKYALEALRLATPSFGVLRTATISTTILDGLHTLSITPFQSLFLNFVSAGVDPLVFPDPHQVKLDRPDELYIHHGWGAHACLGRKIVEVSMATQLRCFARLKNLRVAPGQAGRMKSTIQKGVFRVFMNEDWSEWTPFPATWKLLFDE